MEHQIFSFAKMILRHICITSYDLASLGRGSAILYTHAMKNCKTHWYEVVSSALNFPLLKEVSQNWFNFLTLSTSNIEEVSQNCSVVDAVSFKCLRSLVEFLRVGSLSLQFFRKPPRSASLQVGR